MRLRRRNIFMKSPNTICVVGESWSLAMAILLIESERENSKKGGGGSKMLVTSKPNR